MRRPSLRSRLSEAGADGRRLEGVEREPVEGVNDRANADGTCGEPAERARLRTVRVNEVEVTG